MLANNNDQGGYLLAGASRVGRFGCLRRIDGVSSSMVLLPTGRFIGSVEGLSLRLRELQLFYQSKFPSLVPRSQQKERVLEWVRRHREIGGGSDEVLLVFPCYPIALLPVYGSAEGIIAVFGLFSESGANAVTEEIENRFLRRKSAE